jgi:hypothetical protein
MPLDQPVAVAEQLGSDLDDENPYLRLPQRVPAGLHATWVRADRLRTSTS